MLWNGQCTVKPLRPRRDGGGSAMCADEASVLWPIVRPADDREGGGSDASERDSTLCVSGQHIPANFSNFAFFSLIILARADSLWETLAFGPSSPCHDVCERIVVVSRGGLNGFPCPAWRLTCAGEAYHNDYG